MSDLFSKFESSAHFSILTDCQKKFVKIFLSGKNVFLTGAAGSGKSFVVEKLHKFLSEQGVSVGKTASTGVAAMNIGGSTIHSWAGMGLADEDINGIIKTARRNRKAVDRIVNCKVLILDEISMISADFLDKLDVVLKYFRGNNDPFGGLQILLLGDVLQLPPVFKGVQENSGFCFNSRSWKEAKIKVVNLKINIRQSGNNDFIDLLNSIRVGETDKLGLLKSRINAEFADDGIKPVKIFCKNLDVDKFNKEKLSQIDQPLRVFNAIDSGLDHHIKHFDKNCPAPKVLELKVGAQVMLLKNYSVEEGLINGSIGVVTNFTSVGVEVKFSNGRIRMVELDEWAIKEQFVGFDKVIVYRQVATRNQIPLKLAWSSTVHKTQGSTLDRIELDLDEAFACGQVYVSLSRVRNLESLSLKEFSPSKVMVNQECLDFYRSIK